MALENRFMQTADYVAIDLANEDTFSNEYAILMQAIGGELDSFYKEYCGFQPTDYKNITDYAGFILNDYPGITTQSISVLGTQIKISPFNGWSVNQAKQSLFWWLAYDDIKHSRYVNKKVASQKNVINLLGALYLMEIKYLHKITDGKNQPDVPDTQSRLFSIDNWTYHYIPLNSAMAVIDGELNVEFANDDETDI